MDKKIPEDVVLTAAYALSKEWNLHYPDAVRMASVVLSVGQQRQPAPRAPVEARNAILDALNLVHAEGRAGVESATAEMADRLAALTQQPAAERGDVRGLVALAEQMERDAAGCRRDGYIDAAVVKEDCAYRIHQTLGISAIAEAVGMDAPGSREWMAEVCRAAALSLAAHGVWNDQLLKVADWIAQQGGEVT